MTTTNRRDFIKQSSILFAGSLMLKGIIMRQMIPQENWISYSNDFLDMPVEYLLKRGKPTTYYQSKNELAYIGMPIGGFFSGTVYLSGDGRLWLWDIFNANQEGVDPKVVNYGEWKNIHSRDGANYIVPSLSSSPNLSPIDQGIILHIHYRGNKISKQLIKGQWDEIAFEATYPIATIYYTSKELPIQVKVNVFSPFIPLEENHSSYPATIYSINIENISEEKIEVEVIGFIQNKTAPISAKNTTYYYVNKTYKSQATTGVYSSCEKQDGTIPTDIMQKPDVGNLTIASLDPHAIPIADFNYSLQNDSNNTTHTTHTPPIAKKEIDKKLLGAISIKKTIQPNTSKSYHFIYAWFFKNLDLGLPHPEDKGRYYQNYFNDAKEVAIDIVNKFNYLTETTRLWQDTWYQSSLPWWYLERTLCNISTLATTTCHRFKSGRFYAWEGVGCCPGTCTHVWEYAFAIGRLFPHLEKITRQQVDYGIAFQPDGSIWYRAEFDKQPAVDGQSGIILRTYISHKMSTDNTFLASIWDKVKLATQFLMKLAKDKDGLINTPLMNTLDAKWYGKISWICSLGIAAVAAAEQMAIDMNDKTFATDCASFVSTGTATFNELLFNGQYFIHLPDPTKGKKEFGSYNTSLIDQVLGQSWAWQADLGQLFDTEKIRSALQILFQYNFQKDVGPLLKKEGIGRPYAIPGEAGMVMDANVKNDTNPYGNVSWTAMYFHECMTGFEHQVAAHLMAEGMVIPSMTVTAAIHNRYNASKRNPFNEIECSDHYARAMASYGSFIAASGFVYHGPKKQIGFYPKINPEDFQSAFVVAKGWGQIKHQWKKDKQISISLLIAHGSLSISCFQIPTVFFMSINMSQVTLKRNHTSLTKTLTHIDTNKDNHFIYFQEIELTTKDFFLIEVEV